MHALHIAVAQMAQMDAAVISRRSEMKGLRAELSEMKAKLALMQSQRRISAEQAELLMKSGHGGL